MATNDRAERGRLAAAANTRAIQGAMSVDVRCEGAARSLLAGYFDMELDAPALAAHIAANDPQTVLRDLAEMARLERELESAQGVHRDHQHTMDVLLDERRAAEAARDIAFAALAAAERVVAAARELVLGHENPRRVELAAEYLKIKGALADYDKDRAATGPEGS